MSRWLKSVNSLLEQLDGQVGDVVEEGQDMRDGDPSSSSVDAILAQRGIVEEDDEDDEDEEDDDEDEDEEEDSSEEEYESNSEEYESAEIGEEETEENVDAPESEDTEVEKEEETIEFDRDTTSENDTLSDSIPKEEEDDQSSAIKPSLPSISTASPPPSDPTPLRPPLPSISTRTPSASSTPPPSDPTPIRTLQTLQTTNSTLRKESTSQQKELRKLRRTILKLNEELNFSTGEMSAQKQELERAAVRLERDRVRHARESETFVRDSDERLKAVLAEREELLEKSKESHEEKIGEMRERLRVAEEMRVKEGGDMEEELEGVILRERTTMQKMLALEDEKDTLVSQVASHQTQLNSIQLRLDSVTEKAQTASEREREVEDRLDAALSVHARQLSHRQARESELERTVADLGAALVVAKQRELNRIARRDAAGHSAADGRPDESAALAAAGEETETLQARLSLERQHIKTLHSELRDITKERSEEEATASARQRTHDRRVADLTSENSSLKSSLRESKEDSEKKSQQLKMDATPKEDDEAGTDRNNSFQNQLSSLSEKVLRQQFKIDHGASEISTLNTRLRVALSRAESAETRLTTSNNASGYDEEMGSVIFPKHGGNKMRKRGRGLVPSKGVTSIRSTMGLSRGQSGGKENIGRVIDVLDNFSVMTGNYLRYNPMARAFFIIYIIILHVWTFCLLSFHAHSYESDHTYFRANHDSGMKGGILGPAGGMPNGVEGLIQKSALMGKKIGEEITLQKP